mgnify:CR=1 FL=1
MELQELIQRFSKTREQQEKAIFSRESFADYF